MYSKDIHEKRRFDMVEKQIVSREIRDERILEAMRAVPRHLFMEEALREKAYGDSPLPIGERQTISQPYMVAVMTEMLRLKGDEKVLEIGTGSGYQTAVLSRVAGQVYSVERIPALLAKARKTLEALGYSNVALRVTDGTYGWKEYAPYDAIIVTAGGPEVPPTLINQLAQGGRLVIPVGNEDRQYLHKITKGRNGTTKESISIPCSFVKLVGHFGWQETKVF